MIAPALPKKFLIIRMSSIGDVLLASPLIRILKKEFPDCRIDFVIKKEYLQLIEFHPFIHKKYVFDKANSKQSLRAIKTSIRQENYNIIVDIHNNFRSKWLRSNANDSEIKTFKKYVWQRFLLVMLGINRYRNIVPVYQRYLDSLQLEYDYKGLDLYLPDEAMQYSEDMLKTSIYEFQGAVIGIAPGASFATKQWPKAYFAELISYLTSQRDIRILLFGGPADTEICNELEQVDTRVINFAGKLSLLQTAAMISHCNLMITNDSGLMHMAAAMKRRVVAIFGSTVEQLGFYPYTTQSVVLENKHLKCRPCSHVGRHKCPKQHFKCMQEIYPKQVMNAVLMLLQKQ